MRSEELLRILLGVLGDSGEYFVSGSMSFLPPLGYYRQPGTDIDVSIREDVFRDKIGEFKKLGKLRALRLSEVAVANTSSAARFISPKTGFIHIDTSGGLLDISLYRQRKESIELMFGLGFTLRITGELIQKVAVLECGGEEYKAAPFEIMLITKSVEYFQSLKDGNTGFKESKHYKDLLEMAKAADWDLTERLLQSLKVCWMGRPLPRGPERKLNPCGIVDIGELKRLGEKG